VTAAGWRGRLPEPSSRVLRSKAGEPRADRARSARGRARGRVRRRAWKGVFGFNVQRPETAFRWRSRTSRGRGPSGAGGSHDRPFGKDLDARTGRTRRTAPRRARMSSSRRTMGAPFRAVPSRGIAAGLRSEPSGVASPALPPMVLDAGRHSRGARALAPRARTAHDPVLCRLELRLSLLERCRKRPGFLRGSVLERAEAA
jgi:hypothetical protein